VQDVIKKAEAGGFNALALTADFTWYGNCERDVRNGIYLWGGRRDCRHGNKKTIMDLTHSLTGFTIPPNYSASQIYQAAKAPAWTWDFVSTKPYSYACINTEVPADSLAAFVNAQINPAFDWDDAVRALISVNFFVVSL